MWKAISWFCYGFSILFYKPCSCYPAGKLKHTLVSIALISYICSQILAFSFQWLPSSKLPSKVSLSFKGWSIVFEGKEQASWLKVTEGPWVGESGTPGFRKFSADSSCRCYPVCGCFHSSSESLWCLRHPGTVFCFIHFQDGGCLSWTSGGSFMFIWSLWGLRQWRHTSSVCIVK